MGGVSGMAAAHRVRWVEVLGWLVGVRLRSRAVGPWVVVTRHPTQVRRPQRPAWRKRQGRGHPVRHSLAAQAGWGLASPPWRARILTSGHRLTAARHSSRAHPAAPRAAGSTGLSSPATRSRRTRCRPPRPPAWRPRCPTCHTRRTSRPSAARCRPRACSGCCPANPAARSFPRCLPPAGRGAAAGWGTTSHQGRRRPLLPRSVSAPGFVRHRPASLPARSQFKSSFRHSAINCTIDENSCVHTHFIRAAVNLCTTCSLHSGPVLLGIHAPPALAPPRTRRPSCLGGKGVNSYPPAPASLPPGIHSWPELPLANSQKFNWIWQNF